MNAHPDVYPRQLPNGRIRNVSRFCQRGHDKQKLGYTSKGSCRECKRARCRRRRRVLDRYKLRRGCFHCGYKKCASALHFHHKDKSKKKFQVAFKYDCSRKRLVEELRECIVLCSNCHAELHENERGKRGWYANSS